MTDEPVPVTAVPRPVSLYNPANVLTAVRIVLVPVFVALVVASDMVDVGLADRRLPDLLRGLGDRLRRRLDRPPLRAGHLVRQGRRPDRRQGADRQRPGAAVGVRPAAWWVTGLILVREWGVTALRFWVIRYGIIPASRGGKLKTALQIAAIAWYLWPVPAPFDVVGAVADGGGAGGDGGHRRRLRRSQAAAPPDAA